MEMVQSGMGTTWLTQPLQLSTGGQTGDSDLRDSKEGERLEGGERERWRKEGQWLAGTTQPPVQPGEGGREGREEGGRRRTRTRKYIQ